MIHSPTYFCTACFANIILDALGIFSSIKEYPSIWAIYKNYALSKLEDATFKVRGASFYVSNLNPKEAEKELKALQRFIPILNILRNLVNSIQDNEFCEACYARDFKDAANEFFDAVNMLYDNLLNVANIHSSYQLSMPVLAVDWDSQEDEHWDNY